jgi:Flp pilus assembly protein TadG
LDRRRERKDGGEHGSASIEFVLVLPLVLVMALALVQVGLLIKDQIVVQEAARAGAREAAVTTDDQEAEKVARDAAVSLDQSQLEVSVARDGGAGAGVTVTVVYHAPVDVPLVEWLFPDIVDIGGGATMRQEVE